MGRKPAIDRRIARLARAQYGVISLAQLGDAGLSARGVLKRSQTGRLHRVHRGVYAVGHSILSAEGRWMAAVLACGSGSVLSHRCAGALLGLRPTASPRVQVTVPTSNGRTHRPGIEVHRSQCLSDADVTTERGIPVTSPARTLLDLAGVLDAGALARAVERAEALRLFDLRRVRAVLDANPKRHGASVLARVLAQHEPDGGVTRSELEGLFVELCTASGLPRPRVNRRVGPYEVDFLWPDRRLIVETDGHATHGTRVAFERDRERDARLMAAGYRVVRFTYRQVTREQRSVVGIMRSLLAAQPERSISSTR